MHTPRPGHAHPRALRLAAGPLYRLVRLLHRPTLSGLNHLPADGPYLLVANHSAGIGAAELLCIAALWARHAPDRPLAGFAHAIGFSVPPLRWLWHKLGVIPSTYEAAHQALDQGVPLLVFPGGDHETLRPVWQADRVDLGGRKGFLRIALQQEIPIVPLGIRGSHYTAPMLYRAGWLAHVLIIPRYVLGIKRWGLSLFGLLIAAALLIASPLAWPLNALLAYLWLSCPLIFLPILPATITLHIGAPLPPDALFSDDDPDLDRALSTVQGALQALVTGQLAPLRGASTE